MKRGIVLAAFLVIFLGFFVTSDFGSWSAYLNASSKYNCSCDNLSLTTELDSNSSYKRVVSWYIGVDPIQVLNLPFEDNFTGGDEQTTDFSGYNHSVYVYGPVFTNGSHDGFSYFNFSERCRIEIEGASELNISQNLTILVWIKLESNETNKSYVINKGSNRTNYALLLNGTEKLLFEYTGSQNHSFSADLNIQTGEWHFVAVSVNKTNIQMFLDGNSLSVSPNDSLTEEIVPQGGPVYIGRNNPLQVPTGSFIGGIDDLVVFDGALSAQQIKMFYEGEAGISSYDTKKGEIWSAKVFFFNRTGSYENRTSNTLEISSAPNITINKPSSSENRNKLSVYINVSVNQESYVWYSVDSGENETLCLSCSSAEEEYFLESYGNHSLTVYAGNGCGEMSIKKMNFSVVKDSDLDGTPDSTDSDDDDDGIADVNDSLVGAAGNVATTFSSLNLSVGGSFNLSQEFEGVQTVNFTNGSSGLIVFDFNFSASKLDLSNITIRQANNSQHQNQILIRGINLSLPYNKTVYLEKENSSSNSVCVHDAEAFSMNEVSSNCNGSGEVVVPCPGTNSSYNCSVVGDFFRVSGLRHSILFEFVQASSSQNSSQNSSENSNSNENSNSGEDSGDDDEECTTYWNCTAWGPCVNGTQKRNCTKVDKYCENKTKPDTERNCSIKKDGSKLDKAVNLSQKGKIFWLSLNLSEIKSLLNSSKANLSVVFTDSEGKEVYRLRQEIVLDKNSTEVKIDKVFSPGGYQALISVSAGNKSYESKRSFSIEGSKKKNLSFVIPIVIVAVLLGAGFLIKKYVGLMRVGKYKIQLFLKQKM